jgi:hypothetical protein
MAARLRTIAPAWGRSSCRSVGPAVLLLALSLSSTANSQTSPEGSIRGIVRDAQGAVLSGVKMTATSPDVQESYTAVTDGTGTYRLVNVSPGTYAVKAQLDGFRTAVRQNLYVRAGLNLGLDLTMEVGDVAEAVTIAAESPMLETRTAVTALNVNGELQRALPLSTRQQWYDFMRVVPGTIANENIRRTTFAVSGSNFDQHVIQIDGADVSAGAQSSLTYLMGSPSILADVQIKTGGVDASAPLGEGAVINAVTRSGTNEVKGNASVATQLRRWNSNNVAGGTTSAYSIVQPEAAMGGPLWHDKSWLFGSYRYMTIDSGISRTAAQLNVLETLQPAFEPFDATLTSRQSFIKSTTQISTKHRLEAFHQYGLDESLQSGTLDTGKFLYGRTGGHAVAANMQSIWGSHFVSRAVLSFTNQSNPTRLSVQDEPARPVHSQVFTSNGVLSGTGAIAVLNNDAGGAAQDAPAGKLTASFDTTYYVNGRLGSHEFQTGVYVQPKRQYEFQKRYPNNGFAVEEVVLRNASNAAAGWVPFHRKVYDQTTFTTSHINTTDYAWYAQDTWKPSSRLTFTPGIRFDWIKRRDQLFGVVVQDTLAIGPRFGVNYAITRDARNVARASWSRLHDAVAVAAGTTAGTSTPGFTDYYDTNLDGVFETVLTTPAVTARTTSMIFDLSNYRQPHADELTVGYTRQLPAQLALDFNVVRREFRERIANIEVNGKYANGQFVGYADPSLNSVYALSSNVYNWPVYTGINVSVTQSTRRLNIIANYGRQFRHMEGTWQPNDPASFIQPSAFPNDRSLGFITLATQNSLSGSDMTFTSQWRDHVFRLATAWRGPWQLTVSSAYTVQSGAWSGPVVTRLAASDPQFGPPTLQLPNGRVVANPLATTIRFAFATRGDGQVRLPALQTWNIRVGRDLWSHGIRIQPTLEIQNVLNGGSPFDFQSGANQLYNPNYGQGTNIQPPRSAQISVRVWF